VTIKIYSHLLTAGYSDTIIEELKNALKLDGWKEDSTLPSGWLSRRTKKHAYFLTEDGKYLQTIKEAQEHLQSGKYNDDVAIKKSDKTVFETDQQYHVAQKSDHEWLENNYLPEGWLHKKPKSNFIYIWVRSREGLLFKSFKQVDNFFNSNEDYSDEDVERFTLFPDGIPKRGHKSKHPTQTKSHGSRSGK
jgi:hypothetical protein